MVGSKIEGMYEAFPQAIIQTYIIRSQIGDVSGPFSGEGENELIYYREQS